jgi:hypothetical protein
MSLATNDFSPVWASRQTLLTSSPTNRAGISSEREKQLNEIAVSDRAALACLTQFPATPAPMRGKPLSGKGIEEKLSDAPAWKTSVVTLVKRY